MQIRLPYPHKGQQIVRQQARRFNWLSAGRRWRKTTLVMAIAVESALDGGHYLWGAPTFDQVRIGFNETKRACHSVADFNQTRMTATFPSGGRITYRSLDNPDNARGFTADGVVIDECADVKPAAWTEVLRPMLIDTNGWAWGIGTPRGYNWFYKEHQTAIDREDTAAWQVPTLGVKIQDGVLVRRPHPLENPDIPFEEIKLLYETISERSFAQEILAQFVELSGGVFRGVMAAAKVSPSEPNGGDYIFGVDWGKHNDFTVITVLGLDGRMVAMDRFNQIDYTLQVGRLKALAERYRPMSIIAEKNSMGEPLIEQLHRDGLPVQAFTTTNASKAQAIEALALAFERQEITIINDSVLVGELQAYEMERLPSGMLRYNAPAGMHDDTVMSLALAWHGVANPTRAITDTLSEHLTDYTGLSI